MAGFSRAGFAGACAALMCSAALGVPEYNPIINHPVPIGAQADRLVVGFRVSPGRAHAATSAADVLELAGRIRLPMARSRQLTASMHVMFLSRRLYGAEVGAMLRALRADPAVKFADVDERRYPLLLPNDPFFSPSADASGQWFMQTPSSLTAASDAAATDAVSAWNLTTGSTSTVIADVDSGVRFDHPDLRRAGFGGRLLPGYDFVSEDENRDTGARLGTYLIANDGDGWDPDPSDPGDWINASDQTNPLFPSASCPIADSSWHGTRVLGLLGALTDNALGVAGMTWNPYLLPIRALGKCGGYDSDIITGMQWAAGMAVSGVPDNPFPATIINLSVGGAGACPSDYADVIATLGGMGVLVVASAGNASGPVDAPGNCAGVLAVAGLRNVGTKVGYSSFGPQIGLAAPAGNCVNASGPCLRSIDTTTNTGLTVPADSTYTNELEPNLGTSFSAPIVTGTAALMRAVNGNLTPAQLIGRLQSSATPFPQPSGLPVCPASAPGTGECACPNDGSQCGAGMLNAFQAVAAAQRPIAAVKLPTTSILGASGALDASGSVAACGRSLATYAWQGSGGVVIESGAASSNVLVTATGAGTITLTVTDNLQAIDTALISVDAGGMLGKSTTTPSSAGSAATACPKTLSVAPVAPTLTASFAPASVGENVVSTLTIVLGNRNPFALTQSALSETLPAGLHPAAAPAGGPATNCGGAAVSLTATAAGFALANAIIPAGGTCTVTLPVQAAAAGSYTAALGSGALETAPGGANNASAAAALSVTAPQSGGGGAWGWWESLAAAALLLARRRRARLPSNPINEERSTP